MSDTSHLSNFRWDDLRAFLAVARAGTLAAAAEDAGVNASTLHRRIAALEDSLAVTLFERAPRGYSLTTLGAALVPNAEDVEEAVLALRRAVVGHDRDARGPVTLTMPGTMVSLVADALRGLHDTCPGVRPVLIAEDRALSLGDETDIALRASDTPPQSAVGRRLARLAWAVFTSRSECDDAQTPHAGAWAVYASTAGPRAAMAWREKHYPDVDARLTVSSVGAMRDALASGAAELGLLPCYVGDRAGLERVGEPIDEAATPLWLLIHADLRRSARVRALLDYLTPKLEAMRPALEGG